jgi:hypothetical protein
VVEQTPATPTGSASAQPARAEGLAAGEAQPRPGFVARGRLRRRARFLRKARELAYRDLGGLVFSLHRFGQQNDPLVLAKLSTIGQIDTELRALESALQEPQPITVLREAGITACARCAAIHSSEDRFCPNCGLPLSRRVDLPVASPAAAPSSVQLPQSTAPVVSAVRAWTSPAATQATTPAAAPPQSSPLPAAQPATDQATMPKAPAPPQRGGLAARPPTPQSTEVNARPPAVSDAPGGGKTAGPTAPLDGRTVTEPQRSSPPDEDQPTEIMRPSGPAPS